MSQNQENAREGGELPDTNGIYMSVFFFQHLFTNLSEN
jgi:hypothetical protein